MNFKIVAIIIAVFIIPSCQRQAQENAHDHSIPSTHEEHSHANVLNHKFNITLNDGEKWIANKETTDGMNNMINLIKDFPADANSDNCRTMKERLNAEYATIIEKCTMTGEAHNQLHNFLVPLSNYINELDAGDMEICRKNIERINDHLAEYSGYFN